jgi:hypothetical protein
VSRNFHFFFLSLPTKEWSVRIKIRERKKQTLVNQRRWSPSQEYVLSDCVRTQKKTTLAVEEGPTPPSHM